jgi:hypothetical protein
VINAENINKMLSERFGVKIENDGSYIRHRHKLFTLIVDPRNREVRYYKNFYEPYNSEKAKKNLENIEKMYKTQEDFIKEKTFKNLIVAVKERHIRNEFKWRIVWDVIKTKQETINKLRKIREKELKTVEANEEEYKEKLEEFNKIINDFSMIKKLKRMGFVITEDD